MIRKTSRLYLRQWREEDLAPFAVLNADPRVMEFFPAALSKDQSDAMVQRLSKAIEERGWGLWAVEKIDNMDFVGFVGLSIPSFKAHFTPCVEVGWRLKFEAWGYGYASEAARECLRFGFEELDLEEIVSFTSEINLRSIKVMERLKMTRNRDDDFYHPGIESEHRLARHVLYRLGRPRI